MRKPFRSPPKREHHDPQIIELHNELTGKTKWRVVKSGYAPAGHLLMAPFSREFDTREEAIACYADNFGWVAVADFQPTREDASYGYATND